MRNSLPPVQFQHEGLDDLEFCSLDDDSSTLLRLSEHDYARYAQISDYAANVFSETLGFTFEQQERLGKRCLDIRMRILRKYSAPSSYFDLEALERRGREKRETLRTLDTHEFIDGMYDNFLQAGYSPESAHAMISKALHEAQRTLQSLKVLN